MEDFELFFFFFQISNILIKIQVLLSFIELMNGCLVKNWNKGIVHERVMTFYNLRLKLQTS